MQVTETLSEPLKRVFCVVLPAAEIDARCRQKAADIAKTMNLAGFRPGKVPASLVLKRQGEAIVTETVKESIDAAVERILDERGLRAVMAGHLVAMNLRAAGPDVEFTLEVIVRPEIAAIQIPDFSTLSLIRLKAEPANAAIEAALARLAASQREWVAMETAHAAEKGELVIADFEGRIDDVPFPGGAAIDAKLEVAGPGYIAGFTEQIEGIRTGETRRITVTFPAGYQAADLAGKEAVFTITAKSVHKPVTPDMNEALAMKLGFDSLDDVRQGLAAEMRREYEGASRLTLKRQLLDLLSERVPFAVPDEKVQTEFDLIWSSLDANRRAGRQDEEDKGKNEATLKAEYRAIAERRVRLGLLLTEIGRMNDIVVKEDELQQAIQAETARNPACQAPAGLHGSLLEEKVVDFILARATVTERTVTPEELAAEAGIKAR